MNRIFGIILGIISLSFFIYSTFLDGYRNYNEFSDKVMNLSGTENASEKFRELRTDSLTSKFIIQDSSINFLILSIFIIILSSKNGFDIKIPRKKSQIIILGIFASIWTVISYVGGLFLDMERFFYPPWADSMGIPLMAVPYLSVSISVWLILNLLGIKGELELGQNFKKINFKKVNYWYLTNTFVAIILSITAIYQHDIWFFSTTFIWAYFYLTILSGRMNAKKN